MTKFTFSIETLSQSVIEFNKKNTLEIYHHRFVASQLIVCAILLTFVTHLSGNCAIGNRTVGGECFLLSYRVRYQQMNLSVDWFFYPMFSRFSDCSDTANNVLETDKHNKCADMEIAGNSNVKIKVDKKQRTGGKLNFIVFMLPVNCRWFLLYFIIDKTKKKLFLPTSFLHETEPFERQQWTRTRDRRQMSKNWKPKLSTVFFE